MVSAAIRASLRRAISFHTRRSRVGYHGRGFYQPSVRTRAAEAKAHTTWSAYEGWGGLGSSTLH